MYLTFARFSTVQKLFIFFRFGSKTVELSGERKKKLAPSVTLTVPI